jgi:carbohydrate kinase (thermoresistant glucokinase family)
VTTDPRVIVLMGVAGSGKTTVGRLLASQLGWRFLDGDDLHPAANVVKMKRGAPLDDTDRAGWLAALGAAIEGHLARGQPAVVACSALKRAYRRALGAGRAGVAFVYLRGDELLLRDRLRRRSGHFAGAELLASQLSTLEEPAADEGIPTVSVSHPPEEIVAAIRAALRV